MFKACPFSDAQHLTTPDTAAAAAQLWLPVYSTSAQAVLEALPTSKQIDDTHGQSLCKHCNTPKQLNHTCIYYSAEIHCCHDILWHNYFI